MLLLLRSEHELDFLKEQGILLVLEAVAYLALEVTEHIDSALELLLDFELGFVAGLGLDLEDLCLLLGNGFLQVGSFDLELLQLQTQGGFGGGGYLWL